MSQNRCQPHNWMHENMPCPYCLSNQQIFSQPPTELTSLREIKDKLDAIKEQLRTMDAGLHETAMRNHQQVRVTLDEIMNGRKLNSEKWEIECNRAKRIEDYLLWLVEHTPPRKASKKARSTAGKAM